MHQVFDVTLHTTIDRTYFFFSKMPQNTNKIRKYLTSVVLTQQKRCH